MYQAHLSFFSFYTVQSGVWSQIVTGEVATTSAWGNASSPPGLANVLCYKQIRLSCQSIKVACQSNKGLVSVIQIVSHSVEYRAFAFDPEVVSTMQQIHPFIIDPTLQRTYASGFV